jgi:exodeoxyribonuclease V gamma subunit
VLTVYRSNRAERLADALAEVLGEPLGDALRPEQVVVQSRGMARWLSLALAERLGVCANVAFPLPAGFLWEVFRAVLPAEVPRRSSYGPEVLAWRLFGLLDEIEGEPGFEPVGHYLGGGDELKRYRLAGRIATTLDQYLVYRSDWVRRWERGEDQHWQARLWRRLVQEGPADHWVRVHDAFLRALNAEGAADRLPTRVCLFAVPELSPSYLDLLGRISESTEVHLFCLTASEEYTADLDDARRLARRRERRRRAGGTDDSAYADLGNPLLASLGRLAQAFVSRLQDYPHQDVDDFEPAGEETLLGVLQDDMRVLVNRGREPEVPALLLPEDDVSVEVHSCHSALREVQVLHDRLLDLFQRWPDLEPRQVAVMAPDVGAYAPLVEAVFGSAGGDRAIPFALAERGVSAGQPLVRAVLSLIDLPLSRLAASEVLSLLEIPAVMRRLGLDAEGLLSVRRWVRESGIRWGAAGASREALDLPAYEENSWAFGLRRLFLGYAMPAEERLYRGVLPYPHLEGNSAVPLGLLQRFVDALQRWQGRLAGSYSASEWPVLIGELLDEFLAPDEDDLAALQAIRDAAAALAEEAAVAGFHGRFAREVARSRLAAALEERSGAAPVLSGAVTFGGLGSLRAIPFRVVCLLGMNGASFPRLHRPPSFDLMAAEPRAGDRSRREEDRYLFLEAVLSAREVLHLSYVGRNVRDNSPQVPSVLVSELLDYLEQAFTGDVGARVVVEHPLQPFSPRYFDGKHPRLVSYASEWLPPAEAAAPRPFVDRPLPAPDPERREVELDDLVHFFDDPARGFLRQRLGVHLEEAEEALEDAEAFSLDGLAAYALKQEALQRALSGEALEETFLPVLRGRGALPVGEAGTRSFVAAVDPVAGLAGRVRERLAEQREPLEADLALGEFRLRGWLTGLTVGGLVSYRATKVKAKDRLRLWVRHLVLNAVGLRVCELRSRHLAEDTEVHYRPLEAPRETLAALLEAYWRGLSQPLALFPETSYAYARAVADGKDDEQALRAAWKAWAPGYNKPGEREGAYVSLAFRDVAEPLGPEFRQLAEAILCPMLAAEERSP